MKYHAVSRARACARGTPKIQIRLSNPISRVESVSLHFASLSARRYLLPFQPDVRGLVENWHARKLRAQKLRARETNLHSNVPARARLLSGRGRIVKEGGNFRSGGRFFPRFIRSSSVACDNFAVTSPTFLQTSHASVASAK